MEEYWIRTRWEAEQEANSSQYLALDFLESSKSLARSLERRWTLSNNLESVQTTKDLEDPLRTLWYYIILAVERCQDEETLGSIIEFLKGLKALGTLERFVTVDGKPVALAEVQGAGSNVRRQHHQDVPVSVEEGARTLDTKLWTDFPLLQRALLDKFLQTPPVMPKETWTRLHTFAARLTANDIYDLSFFGIWAFFDALETYKPLQVEKRGQTSLAELLPSVMAWMECFGDSIFTYCRDEHVPRDLAAGFGLNWYQPGSAYVGGLAREAGIDKPGFSMERWKLWRKRLLEISITAEEGPVETGGVSKISDMTQGVLKRMDQLNGTVDS